LFLTEEGYLLLSRGLPVILDVDRSMRFPEGYRHIAYLQTRIGYKIKPDMPGLVVVEGWSHYDLYDKPEPVGQALAKLSPSIRKTSDARPDGCLGIRRLRAGRACPVFGSRRVFAVSALRG
jgi:hypothetical protein